MFLHFRRRDDRHFRSQLVNFSTVDRPAFLLHRRQVKLDLILTLTFGLIERNIRILIKLIEISSILGEKGITDAAGNTVSEQRRQLLTQLFRFVADNLFRLAILH